MQRQLYVITFVLQTIRLQELLTKSCIDKGRKKSILAQDIRQRRLFLAITPIMKAAKSTHFTRVAHAISACTLALLATPYTQAEQEQSEPLQPSSENSSPEADDSEGRHTPSTQSSDGGITHVDPIILDFRDTVNSGAVDTVVYDQNDTVDAMVNPGAPSSLNLHYLVGVGISANQAGSILDAGKSVTVTNTVANSGTIGMVIGGAEVGSINGNITVVGTTEARGLGMSGEDFLTKGTASLLDSFTGNINVSSASGSTVGVDLEYGTITNLHAQTIVASSQGGSSVKGIAVGAKGNAGTINTNMTINGVNGSMSFIDAANTASVGVISGTYTMKTLNTHNDSWSMANTFSVGYTVGYDKQATTSSIGFATDRTIERIDPATGLVKSVSITDSYGYNIDWNRTSLDISRNYGLAAGATIFGTEGVDLSLFKNTVLGQSSSLKISILKSGMATGAWLNGSDVSGGALLGKIEVSAATGSAVGLFTTGSDLLSSSLVTQSTNNSSLGHISGHISATVNQEEEDSKAIGIQLGNADTTGVYDTKVKEFSGTISAVMKGALATDGAAEDFIFDGTNQINTDNLTAGIVDMGNQTLNFNADANGTVNEIDVIKADSSLQSTKDEVGTSVSAVIYGADNQITAYGQAILTLAGGIKVNSVGSKQHAITFTGNLTAGAYGHKSLSFQSGRYNVTSEVWNAAEGVTVGGKSDSVLNTYDTARVTLRDIATSVGDKTTIASSKLEFYTNDMSDSSLIFVESGHQLDFQGLTIVKVYLMGDESDYTSRLYFVDATQASAFDADNTGISYEIYLDGSTTAYTQHDNFKIIHDSTGIYLHIPEPSTATLSLLALSGLLARRRRRV